MRVWGGGDGRDGRGGHLCLFLLVLDPGGDLFLIHAKALCPDGDDALCRVSRLLVQDTELVEVGCELGKDCTGVSGGRRGEGRRTDGLVAGGDGCPVTRTGSAMACEPVGELVEGGAFVAGDGADGGEEVLFRGPVRIRCHGAGIV